MSCVEASPLAGFGRFGLKEPLVRGIQAAGYESPRPIQTETIPPGLDGRDVLGLAKTGTGKTAAFALPILNRLLDGRGQGPRALVVAPTRELATQIAAEMSMLGKFTPLRVITVFGGVPANRQIKALRRNPDVVVGCPGRLLDLMQQGVLHLDRVETLVLDEADHMFDMGFLPDIRRVLKALPPRRQNLLFSATMPKAIRHLADDVLDRPAVVELTGAAPAETIDHSLYLVAERRKRDLLEHLLTGEDCRSAIIFSRTKHRVKRLARQLGNSGHRVVGLQGNMSQAQRDKAMRGFRARRFDVLVATDIAARGLDVSGVSHVINFDVPNTPETYTHRIGRTGRAEQDGVACTFVTGDDHAWVRATERMIGIPIERKQVEGFEAENENRTGAKNNGGSRRGARKQGRRDAPRSSRASAPKPEQKQKEKRAPSFGRGTRRRRKGRGRAA